MPTKCQEIVRSTLRNTDNSVPSTHKLYSSVHVTNNSDLDKIQDKESSDFIYRSCFLCSTYFTAVILSAFGFWYVIKVISMSLDEQFGPDHSSLSLSGLRSMSAGWREPTWVSHVTLRKFVMCNVGEHVRSCVTDSWLLHWVFNSAAHVVISLVCLERSLKFMSGLIQSFIFQF